MCEQLLIFKIAVSSLCWWYNKRIIHFRGIKTWPVFWSNLLLNNTWENSIIICYYGKVYTWFIIEFELCTCAYKK